MDIFNPKKNITCGTLQIIVYRKTSVLILIFLFVASGFFPPNARPQVQNIRFQEIQSLKVETVNSTDSEVMSGIIAHIEKQNQKLGSWQFQVDVNDTRVFYGLVGMSGLGMRFLSALEKYGNILSQDEKEKLLSFAREIGDELLSQASINNATHLIWTVSNNDSVVDYGYDFGLAGIASFYAKLFNHTNDAGDKNTAMKILETIQKGANHSDGYYWNSQLFPLLNGTEWYPTFDFQALNLTQATFLGVNFGTAGIIQAAMDYAIYTGDKSNSIVQNLIDKGMNWILQKKKTNSSEVYFPVANERQDVLSSSRASGIAGLIEVFSQLQKLNATYSLQDEINGMVSWLVGENDGESRIGVTWFNQTGEIFDQIEYGLRYGLAGILKVIAATDISTDIVMTALDDELYNFQEVGREKDGAVLYPERISFNFLEREGSISYEFGAGGLIEVLPQFEEGNFSYLLGLTAKIKAGIYSSLVENSTGFAFIDKDFQRINFSPINGIPSVLEYLPTNVEGEIAVIPTKISFDQIVEGENQEKTVIINNFGDGLMEVSFSTNTSNFAAPNEKVTLQEWSRAIATISFSPVSEGQINGKLTIDYNDKTYKNQGSISIQLHGTGFDMPKIALTSPKNGTTVNGTTTFKFEITDESGIKSATFAIANDSLFEKTLVSGSLKEDGTTYSITVNTQALDNGEYFMRITAIDFLNVKSELTIKFVVSNQPGETIPEETLNILLWGLGGLTAIAAIGATFFTIKYVRGNK